MAVATERAAPRGPAEADPELVPTTSHRPEKAPPAAESAEEAPRRRRCSSSPPPSSSRPLKKRRRRDGEEEEEDGGDGAAAAAARAADPLAAPAKAAAHVSDDEDEAEDRPRARDGRRDGGGGRVEPAAPLGVYFEGEEVAAPSSHPLALPLASYQAGEMTSPRLGTSASVPPGAGGPLPPRPSLPGRWDFIVMAPPRLGKQEQPTPDGVCSSFARTPGCPSADHRPGSVYAGMSPERLGGGDGGKAERLRAYLARRRRRVAPAGRRRRRAPARPPTPPTSAPPMAHHRPLLSPRLCSLPSTPVAPPPAPPSLGRAMPPMMLGRPAPAPPRPMEVPSMGGFPSDVMDAALALASIVPAAGRV